MKRILAIAWSVLPLAAQGYVLKEDAAGFPVHWATSPTFVMSPSLADELQMLDVLSPARAAAMTYASDLPQLGITLQAGATAGVGFDASPGAHNQNEIDVIRSDWPYDENAIAVTLLTVDPRTNEILDADIALNGTTHRFQALDASSVAGGEYDDLQNTLTHEFGHALGLAHAPDPGVVMFAGAPRGEVSKRVLADDDKAGLAFLYPVATGAPSLSAAAQTRGCAAAPAGPGAGLILLALLARRGRAALIRPRHGHALAAHLDRRRRSTGPGGLSTHCRGAPLAPSLRG